ncbi:unnamed protein product [Meganyctiphanes norvegica]|uniref:Uncharacterized protein n=1 Tax=Meganyctiphanes norvegica TaxID=48144 RepID=A0AAV2R1G8_MEGNR
MSGNLGEMPSAEENLCQLDMTSVITSDWTELDKELTPILAELVTLGPGNDQHPAVRDLFNWLVNSQHTGEEFAYVIGELVYKVCMIMEEHFFEYVYDIGYCTSLCKTASEALAMKCPVLEDSWELAAWALVMLIDNNHNKYDHDYSVASDCLTAWIIHVIGDPDICPNPYLRLELMILLTRKIDIYGCKRTQAIESVLSACSSLNIEYISSVDMLEYHKKHAIESVLSTFTTSNVDYQSLYLQGFRHIELNGIYNIFKMLSQGVCLQNFDKKLANKLLEVQSSRCSAIIYDVGFCCAVNHKNLSQPRELYGLIALLKTIVGVLDQINKDIHKENNNMWHILAEMLMCSEVLFALILRLFKATCQTPILSHLVRHCILYTLEIVILINVSLLDEFGQNMYKAIIRNLAQLLRDLPNRLAALFTSTHLDQLKSCLTNLNLCLETVQA